MLEEAWDDDSRFRLFFWGNGQLRGLPSDVDLVLGVALEVATDVDGGVAAADFGVRVGRRSGEGVDNPENANC